MSETKARDSQVGGDHYVSCTIQPRDYAKANGFTYDECSVLRYLTRHRTKNGRQDIEKAIHSLQMLLEDEYPAEKSGNEGG